MPVSERHFLFTQGNIHSSTISDDRAGGTINRSNSQNRAAYATDGLIRRLGTRYLCVLVAVAVLVIVDQAIVQPLLSRLDRHAPTINLAGRQRMLSQKLTKAALVGERATSAKTLIASRNELNETLKQWTNAHEELRSGAIDSGTHRLQSPAIEEQWSQLEPQFQAMSSAAQQIITASVKSRQLSPDGLVAVETILDEETKYLATMDRIVNLMEEESALQVSQLRMVGLGIATAIVVLLIALGWFVVRPATRMIRRQVDELETRVVDRTAELATTLTSLQYEIAIREKFEAHNQRLASQLAHADRVESLGHLAVGLTHELNHPLGAIANYAEACDVILGRTDQKPDHTKLWSFIVQIRQASLRAGQIVRRMRNFVKSNALAANNVELRGLIDEIIALCRHEIDRHQVTFTTELNPRATIVSVDAIQIQQVLVNLVQNALQSMREIPAEQRKVLIRTILFADSVQIDVVDSGPGFQAIDPDSIFESFQTTKSDGLGMGLSICRSIIESHHGTIWAKNLDGSGAMVSLTLPLVSHNAAPLALQSDSVRG
jgi:two-component system sensor kinase FixL